VSRSRGRRIVESVPSLSAAGCRFAIVVSRFNPDVTEGLLRGAQATLAEAGVAEGDVSVVRVPGAFEIPLTASTLAATGRFDAIVALGCLIKGDTMHFEYIASAASHGLMQASLASRVPIAFGVLTTLDDEQAVARSRDDGENKGREAALAAVEMAALLPRLRGGDR
jgi:6,7-dimethyl-8-ribityllumazine synthase